MPLKWSIPVKTLLSSIAGLNAILAVFTFVRNFLQEIGCWHLLAGFKTKYNECDRCLSNYTRHANPTWNRVGSSYVKLLTWITKELGDVRGPRYSIDIHQERTWPRTGVGSSQLHQTSDMNHWRGRQHVRTTVRCGRPSWSVMKSGQLHIFVRYTSSSQPLTLCYNERLEDLVQPLSLYNYNKP